MRAFWKKVFKNLFLELGRKMWFSKKHQKLLYFDKALWPNHLTYSKPLSISGKTMSISFIHFVGLRISDHPFETCWYCWRYREPWIPLEWLLEWLHRLNANKTCLPKAWRHSWGWEEELLSDPLFPFAFPLEHQENWNCHDVDEPKEADADADGDVVTQTKLVVVPTPTPAPAAVNPDAAAAAKVGVQVPST